MTGALIGAAIGILTIVVARAIRGERWLYSVGLLVLPSLYAMFAVVAGEHAVGIKEMLFGIPWIVAGIFLATVSVRWSAVAVGGFWLLHGVFDLVHSQFFVNIGVPAWYPVFCFVVDAVVGSYVLWLAWRIPDANLRHA